ncbi:hypothetical protein ACQJBY_039103 [Aegilops geniculata]
MLQVHGSDYQFAAYWQESLYFNQHDLFMRINLAKHKYEVIKPPEGFQKYHMGHYFGKSKNGVYCALLDALGLRIWYLDETGDQINWILKCDEDARSKALAREDLVFDNDGAGSTKDRSKQSRPKNSLLGFHPNEEIVFLHTPFINRLMVYHFNSSEVQDLGCLPVETQSQIRLCFPYTPCLMGEFSNNM